MSKKIKARVAQVVCPGCKRVMAPSMDFAAVTCILKSCEFHGKYFETPTVPLVPVKETK